MLSCASWNEKCNLLCRWQCASRNLIHLEFLQHPSDPSCYAAWHVCCRNAGATNRVEHQTVVRGLNAINMCVAQPPNVVMPPSGNGHMLALPSNLCVFEVSCAFPSAGSPFMQKFPIYFHLMNYCKCCTSSCWGAWLMGLAGILKPALNRKIWCYHKFRVVKETSPYLAKSNQHHYGLNFLNTSLLHDTLGCISTWKNWHDNLSGSVDK